LALISTDEAVEGFIAFVVLKVEEGLGSFEAIAATAEVS
jgi:hypothetical protein